MGNSRWTRVPAITTPSVELDSSRARLTGPVVGGGPQRPSRTLSPEPWGSSSRTCVHKRVLHTDLWSLGHDPRGGMDHGQGKGTEMSPHSLQCHLSTYLEPSYLSRGTASVNASLRMGVVTLQPSQLTWWREQPDDQPGDTEGHTALVQLPIRVAPGSRGGC